MRPTGLGHGVYKDQVDYGIFSGGWCIGRIYETRAGSDSLRWFWALHAPSKPGTLRTSNQVATLEVAKAEFQAAWDAWKTWNLQNCLSAGLTSGGKSSSHPDAGSTMVSSPS